MDTGLENIIRCSKRHEGLKKKNSARILLASYYWFSARNFLCLAPIVSSSNSTETSLYKLVVRTLIDGRRRIKETSSGMECEEKDKEEEKEILFYFITYLKILSISKALESII